MSYDDFVSNTVKVVEAAGAALMVLGGLYALVIYLMSLSRSGAGRDPYRQLRSNLARSSSSRHSKVLACWE